MSTFTSSTSLPRALVAAALITGALAACDRLSTGDDETCAPSTSRLPEAQALDQLEQVVAARGLDLAPAASTYVHVGDDVIAHAPLAGIDAYTDADFAGGVPIAAVVVARSVPGPLPDGAYVASVQFAPKAASGVVTFSDGAGRAAGRGVAYRHALADLVPIFPGIDEPPPVDIPNITSTHIWQNHKWWVDCTGWMPKRTLIFSVQ